MLIFTYYFNTYFSIRKRIILIFLFKKRIILIFNLKKG